MREKGILMKRSIIFLLLFSSCTSLWAMEKTSNSKDGGAFVIEVLAEVFNGYLSGEENTDFDMRTIREVDQMREELAERFAQFSEQVKLEDLIFFGDSREIEFRGQRLTVTEVLTSLRDRVNALDRRLKNLAREKRGREGFLDGLMRWWGS